MKTKVNKKIEIKCPVCNVGNIQVTIRKNLMKEVVRGLRKQGLTFKEIMKETGLKSTSSVAHHIKLKVSEWG